MVEAEKVAVEDPGKAVWTDTQLTATLHQLRKTDNKHIVAQ